MSTTIISILKEIYTIAVNMGQLDSQDMTFDEFVFEVQIELTA